MKVRCLELCILVCFRVWVDCNSFWFKLRGGGTLGQFLELARVKVDCGYNIVRYGRLTNLLVRVKFCSVEDQVKVIFG